MMDNEIDKEPMLEQYFTVHKNKKNILKEFELKPNGKNEKVTDSNKEEYINL